LRFTDSIPANVYVEGTDGSLVALFHNAVSYGCDRPDRPDCDKNDKNCPTKDEKDDDGRPFTCVLHVICTKKPGFFQNLAAAIGPLFAESPTRYITPVSRGIEAELSDSVLLLRDNHIDFSPALQEMDPATYRVRLQPMSNSAQPSAPLQLQWVASGPALVPVPGVQTGLYRLIRLDPSGEPVGLDAWVLVSGPDRFSTDSSAFQSAVEATKNLPDDVDVRAPRTMLRAYLDSLSRQTRH
jgi:hypothetical protein